MAAFKKKFSGKHVLITGGSEGIGLALAKEFIRANANVTLVARTKSKLEAAQAQLEQLATECASVSRCRVESADVSTYEKISKAVASAEKALGTIDVIVCNAGLARPGYFHELPLDTFQQQIDVNYIGTVNTVKAVYDNMVTRNSGHICIVSSTMGLMGFVGYTAYAASKYAVRGFAESLRNELEGTEVCISMMYPPDTLTPGYDNENTMKPPETAEISAGADQVPADKVAKCMITGIASGRFLMGNPDFGLSVHTRVVKGMVPRHFPGVLLDTLLSCVGPLLHMFHTGIMDRICRRGATKRFSKLWTGSTASQSS